MDIEYVSHVLIRRPRDPSKIVGAAVFVSQLLGPGELAARPVIDRPAESNRPAIAGVG